jgi:phosphatidylinositol alpha 1,6-mannosyltransferase
MRDGRHMRVAIVSESYLPTINGVTASVVHVRDQLHRLGHQTVVIAPRVPSAPRQEPGVVRVASVPMPGYATFRVGLPDPAVARTLRGFEPDVVHLASPAALGAHAASCAQRMGLPTVAVFQTDLAGYAGQYRVGWAADAAWAWLRRVHRSADITLAPSTPTLFALHRNGFGRLALWGRGVDLDRFSPARLDDALRRRLAPHGEVLVGYVGRLAPEKGCEDLAALAGLHGARLVVVGDGPSAPRLRRLLPEAAFLGFLHGQDLARAYASLDVFVHTGRHETFGQTLQEALASGVPVIAPRVGGPVDIVRHGVNGLLVPPGDRTRLRGAVEAVVRDGRLCATLTDGARTSVQDRSWSAVVQQLVGHYRRVQRSVHGDEVAA